MNDSISESASQNLKKIIESARRMGVELDESEALQWLAAMGSMRKEDDVAIDVRQGVFGHRITLLDFSPERLDYFRRVGKLVEFSDVPGLVETALALSGSAAQSRIQSYPGDADFFERVNIKAPTREEACRVLAKIMREKALSTARGDTYQLIEVKFGSYPQNVEHNGRLHKAGSPIAWTPAEIEAGRLSDTFVQGEPVEIGWEQAAHDPGWCKLDWVIADPIDQTLVNASNMLDVTWEAPDGKITPLDGYLDPYFQEVYLDAESIPIFTKLAKQVDSNALDDYVAALEKEVRKYVTASPNYGKAAKRMYNIFRLTGKYEEAAYLRELFDEPATVLYQVWSLIRTIDDTFTAGSSLPLHTLLSETDRLIVTVVDVLEGEKETEIVRMLLKLRSILGNEVPGQELSPQAEAARDEVINLVNNFFYEKLTGVPQIKEYLDRLAAQAA
ncbi:hypothetical protein BECAL_00702 [Bellilinea caldifistulae]|uniref:Uncharacterized protein n=1 Tax=Bellilinea caldifistulae TaxID=360411 RepID=A0A0P6XL24_9CHLR|nr:hypothetical protein [Bellilinea caldifistulae]KPL72358.1 hypothetical protein AC812_16160 [Bellilinea caldifistulae]GAP09558.1 hypothetical protein BECAL_00702 [Bellilinea caldifistulae]